MVVGKLDPVLVAKHEYAPLFVVSRPKQKGNDEQGVPWQVKQGILHEGVMLVGRERDMMRAFGNY